MPNREDLECKVSEYKLMPTMDQYSDSFTITFSHLSKDDLILDIGCSTGKLSKRFHEEGFDTFGIDVLDYSQVYPGMQVKYSPFLGATYSGVTGADTAWYLLSHNHSIVRWVRQALQTNMVPYQNQRNNNYIYKAEYREVVDAISFEGLVGSTGTV